MAYTTIDDPSEYFQTALYTGNGASSRALTNDGNSNLQPDWVWIKDRSAAFHHILGDSSRGSAKKLASDGNYAENDSSELNTSYGYVDTFNTDGFTTGGGSTQVNKSSNNYVAWQWKANGGSTTTNDASSTSVGTIDSVYQANTTAGFSIVTYTGTTSAGTIAHGLGAVPKMIIIKNRDDGAENWAVYHAGIASDAETDYLYLDTTNAAADDANLFNDTAPTSTVFSIGTSGVVNQAEAHIAYCFAEKQGYSKFGSYIGNGNANGAFVYTGFKPALIIIKRTDSADHWQIQDIKRHGSNGENSRLQPNDSSAEATNSTWTSMDFLSNGFKQRYTDSIMNVSSGTYIYIAFAEHPFVSSKGVPTTAR